MTQQTAGRLVEQNLMAIYGYAYSKLYDKSRSEELTSEIVSEILASAGRLKEERAFWGFAWRIAENTFRKFIRREELVRQTLSLDDAQMVGVLAEPEECAEEQDARIWRLRRELSLLSARHRSICVMYYVNRKSCSEISSALGISVEMVKQLLFQARSLLKEGMKMERRLGEKSYNPGTFRLDFWGNRNHYGHGFDKKLPGAILLAAYEAPMTAEELSVELGVAMPYLEETLEELDAAGLIKKSGKKYQTNIVILTKDYQARFDEATATVYPDVAQEVYREVKLLLPQVRALAFHGKDYEDERLLFALLNIAFVNAHFKANRLSPTQPAGPLKLGGEGWLFGHDNDCENSHFQAIGMKMGVQGVPAWFSAVNYTATLTVQNFEHTNFDRKIRAVCDAVLERQPDEGNETLPWLIENGFVTVQKGHLSAAFPVFERDVYDRLLTILTAPIERVAALMIEISDKAETMLRRDAPRAVKSQCGDIAKIHHRLDVAAFLMEALIDAGNLTLPTEKTPLCVWGVRW